MQPINIQNYLFLDIETVPQCRDFDGLSDTMQLLWDKKTAYQRKNDESAGDFYHKAGIWAEFGKIVCISCGVIDLSNRLHVKSFYGDEKILLENFIAMLNKFANSRRNVKLCAHNGKEFDFPYLARRILINNLSLPVALNVQGMKPWETPFVDTMELWKFGDGKHYCALALLAEIFGIPSPKDDIDGSMVAKVYYEEDNLERIVTYCEKDLVTLVRVFIAITQQTPLNDTAITE
ncbi:MAG: 3'-5' exonuclease [Prevotellaceae bacterium]|jgi:uncharacterized protein YprB with RNaseH-like and TPR domain|nr:3'-5' exonuclease [Prevotellaceae bacterium]